MPIQRLIDSEGVGINSMTGAAKGAAESAAEQRGDYRQQIDNYFRVFNRDSGELLGDLANLSAGGMMVLLDSALQPDARLAVEIEWSDSSGASQRFSMKALCRWCRESEQGEGFEAGFQFFDKTILQDTALRMMVTNFDTHQKRLSAGTA